MMENKIDGPKPLVTAKEREEIRMGFEQEVGNELMAKEYTRIKELEVYEDIHDFSSIDLSKFSPQVAFPIEMLIMHTKLPILIDDIQELGTNVERNAIKTKLAEEAVISGDTALLKLYEKNKMQSSDTANCLEMLRMLKEAVPFSQEISSEIEEIKVQFSGSDLKDQTEFKPMKYVYESNNVAKLNLVHTFRALIERIIQSVVASNGKEVK